jgi:hypothetical protein
VDSALLASSGPAYASSHRDYSFVFVGPNNLLSNGGETTAAPLEASDGWGMLDLDSGREYVLTWHAGASE